MGLLVRTVEELEKHFRCAQTELENLVNINFPSRNDDQNQTNKILVFLH